MQSFVRPVWQSRFQLVLPHLILKEELSAIGSILLPVKVSLLHLIFATSAADWLHSVLWGGAAAQTNIHSVNVLLCVLLWKRAPRNSDQFISMASLVFLHLHLMSRWYFVLGEHNSGDGFLTVWPKTCGYLTSWRSLGKKKKTPSKKLQLCKNNFAHRQQEKAETFYWIHFLSKTTEGWTVWKYSSETCPLGYFWSFITSSLLRSRKLSQVVICAWILVWTLSLTLMWLLRQIHLYTGPKNTKERKK